MKRSLPLTSTVFSILLMYSGFYLNGQEALFSEDFSGFTTGTHSSPATNDISGVLDSKTHLPGWTGSKIYSAGGEIKLGTSEVPGWIETPLINISGQQGDLFIRFDICRWPEDATTVRIYFNGLPLGNDITPANDYQTVKIPITSGTVSGRFKFESLAKRFYLDNIRVVTGSTTLVKPPDKSPLHPKIFPNPACDVINITNTEGFSKLEILDIYGRVIKIIEPLEESTVKISLDGLSSGIYIIRFRSHKGWLALKFIVEKNMY